MTGVYAPLAGQHGRATAGLWASAEVGPSAPCKGSFSSRGACLTREDPESSQAKAVLQGSDFASGPIVTGLA